MSDTLEGGPLAQAVQRRPVGAAYAALLSLVVLAISGSVGLALKQPWLFPSLGPTVMLFFQSPRNAAARPLNTLVGHGVGLIAGILCLLVVGQWGKPSAATAGLNPQYLLGGVLSVAITTAVLVLLNLPHPPAGATTLIVSLGILQGAPALLSMAGAIVLITVLGWAADRLLLGRTPKEPNG
ncbi:HPP family protein [Amnibacterium sp. CER49]|uniref:HPP family protein n=1 Tax=Amnibacterium sp. CER49 TaxID=3039161 RepID=UPI00244BA022|nr:HPP family protein [Amnibacterium sp. CER49]MDH2443545.1 HPP family protein [Amnibacterium sp. CER49]